MFVNIAEDEGEHVATMAACLDVQQVVVAPNSRAAALAAGAVAVTAGNFLLEAIEEGGGEIAALGAAGVTIEQLTENVPVWRYLYPVEGRHGGRGRVGLKSFTRDSSIEIQS